MGTRNASLAMALFLVFLPVCASADHVRCGQPLTTGATPKSSDALGILRSAVGTASCEICVCDVNQSGTKTSADALQTLRKAVGQQVTLVCPDCSAAETIGPAGGSVASHDGRLVLEFPPGAVDSPTEITITGAASSLLAPGISGTAIHRGYEVGPDGLVLDPPASVTYAVPASAFTLSGNEATLGFKVLVTENAGLPEALGDLGMSIHYGEENVTLVGELSHFSPVAVVQETASFEVFLDDLPSQAEVGAPPFKAHVLISTEDADLPKPTLEVSVEDCGFHLVSKGEFTEVGAGWQAEITAECQKAGYCEPGFVARIETDSAAGKVPVEVAQYAIFQCEDAPSPVIDVPAAELQAPYGFQGPFATVGNEMMAGIGTKEGSIAFSLDDEVIELDLDDEVTNNGHYGGMPLRHCEGMCKEAWLHYGPNGMAVWNYDDEEGFGMPELTGGPFNQFEDAMPVTPPADRIDDTVYAANVASATIVRIGYDDEDGAFKALGNVVNAISAASQNPSSVFPFPNGSMVITGLGNSFNVEGKLMFHAGTNPATQPTLIGDIGLYPRRIRCAACDVSGIYTCLSSATFSSELFVSKINPATGEASITDNEATGQGPYGVAIVPKLSGEGCFGIVTHYGGGGYTLCDIATNGLATCHAETLPQECPDPRHVADLPDGSFLITCENHALAVRIPPLNEP